MEQNDLDSFTSGLIQRTKERNKFLEQMNLTIESSIGSTIGSTIDSKNGSFIGSPVGSKSVPTFGSPVGSKNAPTFGSPVRSKNVPTYGSPVGYKKVQTIVSPVEYKKVQTIVSPVGLKNVSTNGSPVIPKNGQTIDSVYGATIDSKHDSTICHKNDSKNGSTIVSKKNLTIGSPIGSTIVSSKYSTDCSNNSPTNCSKNGPTFGSTNYSTIGIKNGLDSNAKKGSTIGSVHCSTSCQKNDPKNDSKNGTIKGSKNDSKIGLRGVTESSIDSTDPCLLPLAARRALFEKKMFQPNTEVNKIEEAIGTFKEAQKIPSKDDLSGSDVCEVKDLEYGDENRNPKESYSSDSNISSKADLSSDDENYNLKNQDLKSHLNYSIDSDQKDLSYNDKNFGINEQNCPIQDHINESNGFNVSALLSCADENVSVIRQSTKIYPELPQSDELTVVHKPTSETDEHPLQNFISPIKGCDDQTISVSPKKSVKIDPVKSKPLQPTTPLRTLSMYRREQNIRKTIVSSVEEDELITDLETEAYKREWLKKYHEYKSKKMEELKFEADKYNKIIYQSFRALDLCVQTNNVSERIEAEKILLVNMLKKNACVDELYRLQKEETFDVPMDPVGKITFNKLTLLVKGNFFVSQASGIDLCDYHFICLFTCGDKVIATDALSSSDAIQEASLNFTNKIVFDHLRKDFSIRLVIYALALLKGKRNHDKKNIRLTPRTKSKIKYTHSPALKASPKSEKIKCNFKRMGYVDFTRENIMKSRFSLESFMFDSPLEDQIIVDLAIGCQYNFKFASYLNFHETSGEYPVWNRRWCVLNGPAIYFWRYSEDEGDKQPMGVINLKHCANPSISKASTDISMRPNSFSFITLERQNNSFIPMKHLMAADVRKERDCWLENLNKTLEMVRLWEADCVKPRDQASLDRLLK